MELSPKTKFRESLKEARLVLAEELQLSEQIMLKIAEDAPGELSIRLKKVISRQGKRVRSILMFLIRSMGPEEQRFSLERSARMAASVELLHLASLVHDDVIDSSEMRRGENTAHQDWGNKMAVLLGDHILSKSMELVVGDENRSIPTTLAWSSARLVEGEMMELDIAGNQDVSYDDYISVIDGKTASLLEACGRLGALMAGFEEPQVSACARMGRDFGIAFQIVDDLLDFGLGAQDLGKSTFADLSNGLVTMPMLCFYEGCSPTEKEQMHVLLQNIDNAETKAQIMALLIQSGALQCAQGRAMEFLDDGLKILDGLPDSFGKNLLRDIYQTMAFRAN